MNTYGIECKVQIKEGTQSRLVRLLRLYERGIFFAEAIDAPENNPRAFFIKDPIPFNRFLHLLSLQWHVSSPLSPHFKPLKRIPEQVLEVIPLLNEAEAKALFEKLSIDGFLYPITPLKRGYQPKDISWDEVPSLCLS